MMEILTNDGPVYTWALREVKDEIVELTMVMCSHFV